MNYWVIPKIEGISKSKLHLQLENPPHQISDRRYCPIFYYIFFLFKREGGELPLPKNLSLTLMIITIFNVLLFQWSQQELGSSEGATFESAVL